MKTRLMIALGTGLLFGILLTAFVGDWRKEAITVTAVKLIGAALIYSVATYYSLSRLRR